jgi:hypothetical protein
MLIPTAAEKEYILDELPEGFSIRVTHSQGKTDSQSHVLSSRIDF